MAVIFKIFGCGKSNSASTINLPLLKLSVVSLTATAWLHASISTKALPRSPSQLFNSDNLLVQEISNSPQKNVSAPAIAKLVTVRIMTNSGMGSGVIIQHKGHFSRFWTISSTMGSVRAKCCVFLRAPGSRLISNHSQSGTSGPLIPQSQPLRMVEN